MTAVMTEAVRASDVDIVSLLTRESRWVGIVKDVIANLGLDQLLDNTTSISIKPFT